MPSPARSGYNDGQLSFDALWAEPEPARDEQVRPHGDPPLADVPARPVPSDPGEREEAFFTELGEQAAVEIEELQMQLAGPDPVGEGYLEKVGRLNAARMQAEEKVLTRADPASARRTEEEDDSLPAADLPVLRGSAPDSGRGRRVAFSPAAGEQLAPSGERARVDANLAALRLLRDLEQQDRELTVEEQRTLAAWSGWGAVPGVFDEDRDEWAQARAELLELVGEDGYAAARRTTINAHYTDPAIVAVIWQTVRELGFDGGRVLEPGCGIGTFLGLAPAGRRADRGGAGPATARLAQALYPHATVRSESFADTRLPDGSLRSDGRERAVRRRAAARPAAQRGPALDPQPLHPEVARADPARRAGRGADVPVHARCWPTRPRGGR